MLPRAGTSLSFVAMMKGAIGVEQGDEQHLADGEEGGGVAADGQSRPGDDDGDAGEPREEADRAHRRERRAVAAQQRDERREERHGGHEQSRGAGRERLLRVTEEDEGAGHLDGAEGEHPGPEPQRRAQRAAVQRDRQQDQTPEKGATRDDRGGRERLDRFLDQEVRHTPEQGHGAVEQPPPSGDGRTGHQTARIRRCVGPRTRGRA